MKEKRQNPERVFINRYEPSPDIGLNGEQVKERRENGLTNKTAADNAYSLPNIIIKNVFTYFNYIFTFLINGSPSVPVSSNKSLVTRYLLPIKYPI